MYILSTSVIKVIPSLPNPSPLKIRFTFQFHIKIDVIRSEDDETCDYIKVVFYIRYYKVPLFRLRTGIFKSIFR